jgi:uncharacterized membrane protein YedE/YeeE
LVNEIVILALEVLGILLVAAGLGFLAAVWIGWAGLAVTGVVLLGAAALVARRQREMTLPSDVTKKSPL